MAACIANKMYNYSLFELVLEIERGADKVPGIYYTRAHLQYTSLYIQAEIGRAYRKFAVKYHPDKYKVRITRLR